MDDRLIIKKLTGKLNIIEKYKFQKMLKNDSEFREEFERISKIWSKTTPPVVNLPDKELQWQKVSSRLGLYEKTPNPLWKPAFAVALVIIVIVMGLHVKTNYFGYQYYSTLAGERLEITMSDGSEVSLNADSNIKFAKRFQGNERRVELCGEAYFEVQPDDKEFVVYTENARTRVLGTGFNLWARKSSTRLAVTHGRVGFNYKNSPMNEDIILTKNQKAECKSDNSLSKIDSVNAESVIVWKKGGLYFSETPLHEIVNELQRQYKLQISFAANVDTNATLTGSFINNTPEEILEAISISFGLEFQKQKNQYYLKKLSE